MIRYDIQYYEDPTSLCANVTGFSEKRFANSLERVSQGSILASRIYIVGVLRGCRERRRCV